MAGILKNDGIGWYLDQDGEVRTGTNRPDGTWLASKGWTYLGNAEYGPGGSWLVPLQSLARRHAGTPLGTTLDEKVVLCLANIEQREEDRIDTERKAEEAKLEAESGAIGRGVAEALRQTGLVPKTNKPKPKRGRPRKKAQLEEVAETVTE